MKPVCLIFFRFCDAAWAAKLSAYWHDSEWFFFFAKRYWNDFLLEK
jgi:hypothetical protein